MKLLLYSVKDGLTGIFSGIFMASSSAEAQRLFDDWTRDPQNAIHSNPEDYFLYLLGEFDRDTGKGIFLDDPKMVGKGNKSVAEAGSLAEAHRLIERLGAEVMNLRQEVARLAKKEDDQQ